jgi:hypothetical protein
VDVTWDTGPFAGVVEDESLLCVDSVPPEIRDVKVAPLVVTPLGRLTVTVDAYDELSGLESVDAYFAPEEPDIYYDIYSFLSADLTYEAALDRYVGQLQVPTDAELGEWRLEVALVYDRALNLTQRWVEDFPNARFTVVASEEGDVNGDGECDAQDVTTLLESLGKDAGSPGVEPLCDIVPDGKIDIRDLTQLVRNVGTSD